MEEGEQGAGGQGGTQVPLRACLAPGWKLRVVASWLVTSYPRPRLTRPSPRTVSQRNASVAALHLLCPDQPGPCGHTVRSHPWRPHVGKAVKSSVSGPPITSLKEKRGP